MRAGHSSADTAEVTAFGCRRFWLPRGIAPDLSDHGFLVDPDSSHPMFEPASAVPLESFAHLAVLGLLGEPGMGKSTALKQEAGKIQAAARESGDRLLHVDLAACATDVLVCKRIFESKEFRAWKKGKGLLHLFLDGFDTCLLYVESLVALLLGRFGEESRARLSLSIACRTADGS
jgi:hypothetical protein